LQLHQPERYEQIKSQLMLTLLNRDIYHQFELYPYSDRSCAVPMPQSETATQSAVHTDDKKGTLENHILQSARVENEEDVINHLIDKFSKDAPKIQADPKLHDMSANYGKTSLEEDDKIITETLADIYANQGYYGKAIKMYKKLALIFPKKSSYFAIRILQVKNQQKEAQINTENHQ
jgi:tetratricopeptide (TPR) repeat protein